MGSVNRIVKKSPNFIKWSYYNLVPFHKRYGKVYKETLDFLLHTSKWNEEEKKFYQLMELKSLLAYCYENVSYYRDIFIENKWDPRDFKTVEDLKNFPVLTKKIIIENRDRLIADNRRLDRAYPITTSGSSGDKLEFFVDDNTLKKESAFNMRAYIEQGAKMYDTPSVWLRRYVPKNSDSPLWYYDYELKRLYMSAYHLNSETIKLYIDKINSGNYQTICTYPSSAYILACLCEENNLSLKRVKKIHVTSEKMLNQWYDKVVDVLGIIPCGHYGQMEKVSLMHQTEESKDYKQNYEYGVDEFYDNGDGTYGLIATGFINYYMPFIRYQTEDTFVLENGRIKEINGRSSDILVSASGSRLPGVNFYSWIDKKMPAVKMFQIIQKSDKDIIFNYVQNSDYDFDIKDDIMKGLTSRLGDMNYTINQVDEIKRDLRTNKIRSIINEVKV
jgi:phenylacetate-CoA ligase